jgi:hypothetical protein
MKRYFILLAVAAYSSIAMAHEDTVITITASYKGTSADAESQSKRTVTTVYAKLRLLFNPNAGTTYDVGAEMKKGSGVNSLGRDDKRRDVVFDRLDQGVEKFQTLMTAVTACSSHGNKLNDDPKSNATICDGPDASSVANAIKGIGDFDDDVGKDAPPFSKLGMKKLFSKYSDKSIEGNSLLGRLGIKGVTCDSGAKCTIALDPNAKSQSGAGTKVSLEDDSGGKGPKAFAQKTSAKDGKPATQKAKTESSVKGD